VLALVEEEDLVEIPQELLSAAYEALRQRQGKR
jgi:hypothetical protein